MQRIFNETGDRVAGIKDESRVGKMFRARYTDGLGRRRAGASAFFRVECPPFHACGERAFGMALRADLQPGEMLLNLPDEAGRIRWADIFGNEHPVELEIGSGKGTFLLGIAEALPEHNYVGIEWARQYAEFAADRLRRHHVSNARMVHGEATWWLRCHVPDASLAAIHVYFPDPWPKTRHHKRRLIQAPFLKEVFRMLIPGGKLRLVTDHADYFAHMQSALAGQTELEIISFDSPVPLKADAPPGSIVGTNFERKYIAEGRQFHATAARKPVALSSAR